MKRIIAILMALVLTVLLAACGGESEQPDKDIVEEYKSAVVDISDADNGFFNTMADVELHYYAGELSYILVKEPTLLAFKVSDEWVGGMCVYSGEQICDILQMLVELEASFMDDEDARLDDVELIIDKLESMLLLTEAST